MAMELRELIDVRKTIIISSVKTSHEMPGYFAWMRTFRVNEWIPPFAMKHSASLMRPFLCGMSEEKPFELFKAMLQDADEAFLRWSLRQVMHWRRTSYSPGPIVHIHGSADLTFPISNIRDCTYTIPGGTHDMILSKPEEISRILEKEISN